MNDVPEESITHDDSRHRLSPPHVARPGHFRQTLRTEEYIRNDVIHLGSERFDLLHVNAHGDPAVVDRTTIATTAAFYVGDNASEGLAEPVGPLPSFRCGYVAVHV